MHLNSIYFFILLLLLLFAVFENVGSYLPKYRNVIFLVLVMAVLWFCGFRPLDFDKDIQMYYQYFNEFCRFSYEDIFFNNSHRVKEKGYVILNKLFCDIGFRGLILLCAVLGVGIKSFIILKESKLPITALFIYTILFFPLREYTQIRDALASSFLFLALILYNDKKYYYSVFLFLIAISFHLVALIYLPVLFLIYFIKREIHYYFLLGIGLVLFLLQPYKWFVKLNFLPEQLLRYNDHEGKGSFLILFFAILVLLFYHVSKMMGKINEDSKIIFFVKLSYIGVFFGIITINHPVLSRISNALMFFTIILLTQLIPSWKKFYFKYVFLLFLLIIYYFGARNFILVTS